VANTAEEEKDCEEGNNEYISLSQQIGVNRSVIEHFGGGNVNKIGQ